jgi:hypothetical protein
MRAVRWMVLPVLAAAILGVGSPAHAQNGDDPCPGLTVPGATQGEQELIDGAKAKLPKLPKGFIAGKCTVDVAALDPLAGPVASGAKAHAAQLGTIACGVSGRPGRSADGRTVVVTVSWNCSAVYTSMGAMVNVLDQSKSFTHSNNSGGQKSVWFYNVGGTPGNRAAYECPVNFYFRQGALQVCTTIAWI